MKKEIPERSDVLPAGIAPRNVRRFLHKLGGENQYGEPMLRIILAQHHMILRGGIFHDWPNGTSARDQGGLVFSETMVRRKFVTKQAGVTVQTTVEMPEEIGISHQQPVRVVREMRWLKRFPLLNGWMLQHWEPAGYGGASRTWWESQRVPGAEGLMTLGPFPEKGDYEPFLEWIDLDKQGKPLVVPCWPTIPPLAKMEQGYLMMVQHREKAHSANPEWRKLTRMIEWHDQRMAQERKEDEENRAILRDQLRPIFASSLESGRIREQLAARARARGVEIGHVGN